MNGKGDKWRGGWSKTYENNHKQIFMINHLDLFSGAGGFSLALKNVIGEENIGWVGYSDIDKYANQTFKRRFPNADELGSITDIKSRDLPRIDLVTFGFPCQDLSIAGKRGGLQANRSGLFFEAMRIIGATKPKYIIFENVKGLFSSNKGQDFDIILRTIAEFGYDGQWQLLNTRWFLPQNRERVYFVGHIRGRSRPKVFPIREDDKLFEKKCSRPLPTLTANDWKGASKLNQIGTIGKDSEATRVYDTTCARTIKNGGGMGAKTGLYRGEYGQKALNETLEQNDLKEDDVKALDLYNRKAARVS